MTNEHESAFAQDPTITETSATAVAEETVSEPIEARAEVVETPEAPADVEAEAPVEAPATEPDAEAVTVETPEAPADVEAEAPVEAPATEPDAEAVTVETPVQAVAEPESKKIVIPAERPAIVAKDVSDLPDDLDFGAAIEATVLEFDEGDIVEGTVASIDQDGVLVDVGYKSEGLIPLRELSIRRGIDPNEIVSIGDRIESLVLDKEDDEGRLILSKKRAQYERAWGKIQRIFAEGGIVTGPVIEVVKGGLIVDIGLRGFLPASLVELRRVRDLQPYIGQEIEAKVIELDRNRNNVVLSRRAFLEEQQAEERQAFLDDLAVGETCTGVVSSVVNFGAFVDLGGMDGLVHVSELSYQHVNHPSEVVKVGDEVTVKVLEVDLGRERISLSMKQTQDDPWEKFSGEHAVGDIVDGVVTKTVPFGAFVSVGEGVEGLVHVSEIAMHRVESPELELSIGKAVSVKVTEMDTERRRVSLSIKQALPEWKERKEEPRPERSRPTPRVREFERERPEQPERERTFDVDASLEAILQELKERGIGRR
ncbi:MAG TPA: 30S ribosomal protein S1 [Actinobacteria bacterium]|nr:30S ribosomal protein S1 [bacterium BMS3Bbin01]HDH24580.1 30S ribosomal protein S1 [Actinomycetota bacterium]